MQGEKREIRNNFLRMRQALSKESIENKSFRIIRKLRKYIDSDVKAILFYVPINNEVDLLPLARDMYNKGKTILFPKLINYEKLVPYLIRDLYSDLKKGAYNIPEPDTEEFSGEVDIAFVPGLAFGKNGFRIGYGKGYYDKYLSKAKVKITIGVCFDFQLLPDVPFSNNDFQLDYIISENETLKIKDIL